MSSELSLIDNLLDDAEDPVLKIGFKEEPCFMELHNDDDTLAENWPSSKCYDFLDSFLNFDNHFNLNEIDMRATSPSDIGVGSAKSLSSEDQLSPFLPMEEEQEDITNSCLQSVTDIDSVNSSNESLESEGSPLWNNVNYDDYSPAMTDVNVESELQKSFIIDQSIIDPKVVGNISVMEVEPATVKYEVEDDEPPCITVQETKLNVPSSSNKRKIKQLIRVTPIGSGNPRSILLPVTLKDMKDVKTIKIINATQAQHIKGYKISQESINNKNNTHLNVKYETRNKVKTETTESSTYPMLKLNAEEKRLLQKEGISLPSHYPLTKIEERELKRIRRKIRNKISAQDSRKRKKEYVDGLEDRVKQCHEENVELLQRINVLQTENQNLMNQVNKLQAFIQKENKSTQPTTCLLVLLLSLALVAVPNLRPHSNSNRTELSQDSEHSEKMPSLTGRSRTLLSTHQLMDKEMQQYEDELLPEVEGLLDHDYSPMSEMPPSKKCRYATEKCISTDYNKVSTTSYLDVKQNRKYIEPPLDDVWPPPKPGEVEHNSPIQRVFNNDLKINISKNEDTRTVMLKVEQKK